MNILSVAARLALATVFVVAGIAKLLDRRATRAAVAGFGIPSALEGLVALALPLVELAVAAALLSPWPRQGAIGALGLLATFTVAMTINLAMGRTPECRCFGQLRSSRIGWPSVARNAAFASVAVFVASWPGEVTMAGLGMLAAASLVVAQTVFLWQLFRQHGRLMLRVEQLETRLGGVPSGQGLPVGAPAPASAIESLGGTSKPTVVIFSDPNCPACETMLPHIRQWQTRYSERLRIALVTRETDRAVHDMRVLEGLEDVLLQKQYEIATSFGVQATPAAVLIRTDGTIGSEPALGREAIEELLANPTTTGAM